MMKHAIKYIKGITMLLSFIGLSTILSSCSEKDGPDYPHQPEPAQTTILIYAVATNSLSSNLVSDKNEMLEAARYIDLEKNNIILLETRYLYLEESSTTTSQVNLLRLSSTQEGSEWKTVREYDNAYPVLDPENISETVQYTVTNFPADQYGLIFWSHSTASQPYLPPTRSSSESFPEMGAFGQDQIYKEDIFNQINVDTLADAIPDDLFEFIWFDSCYMSNIETIYEFRNKCGVFVGYPTEVLEFGLPYDIVLPHLVGKNPDIKEAAKLFFSYYADSPYSSLRIATIAVTDMKKINSLAAFCKDIFKVGITPSSTNMLKYTRSSTGPFYDLGDYLRAFLREQTQDANDDSEIFQKAELFEEEWNDILDNCLIYRAATPYNFAGQPIDPEHYTGISTHIYNFDSEDNEVESYYKSLGWFKSTFLE